MGLDIPFRGGEKATAPKVTSKIWTISSPAKCEQSYHALECKTTYSNSVIKIITFLNGLIHAKHLLTLKSTHKNMQICNIFYPILQKFEELYVILSSENPSQQEIDTFHTKVITVTFL